MGLFKSSKDKKLTESIKFMIPQVQRIINDSMRIINSTKKVDTGISRWDLIKKILGDLLGQIPQGETEKFLKNFSINGHDIKTINDLDVIDQEKSKWLRDFLFEEIKKEEIKADALSSDKLKKKQLNKALEKALAALDYLPNDQDLKKKISSLESGIK